MGFITGMGLDILIILNDHDLVRIIKNVPKMDYFGMTFQNQWNKGNTTHIFKIFINPCANFKPLMLFH